MSENLQLRKKELNSIYRKDPALYNHLPIEKMPLGLLHDVNLALGDRCIDDSPKKIVLKADGIPNDFCEALRCRYNATPVEEDEVMGEVFIAGYKFLVDIELKRAIVALLEVGVTPDKELAIAVRNIFRAILVELSSHASDTDYYMTKENFINTISKVKGQYEKKLINTLKELFND